jgi:hypothetical protein
MGRMVISGCRALCAACGNGNAVDQAGDYGIMQGDPYPHLDALALGPLEASGQFCLRLPGPAELAGHVHDALDLGLCMVRPSLSDPAARGYVPTLAVQSPGVPDRPIELRDPENALRILVKRLFMTVQPMSQGGL